jgi:hypothetical protein
VSADIVLSAKTSATPTPTPTMTPSPGSVTNISSQANYVIDSGYFDCGDVAEFVDCVSDQIYYINKPILLSGSPLNTGTTIYAEINGLLVCADYIQDISGAATDILTNIVDVYSACTACTASFPLTPTPTPTSTVTATPTPTPTPTNIADYLFVFTSCTNTTMIIQQVPVYGATVGDVVQGSDGLCYTYIGQYPNNYHAPSGFVVNNYQNYFGTVDQIFNDCNSCLTSEYNSIGSSFFSVRPSEASICSAYSGSPSGSTNYYTTVSESVFYGCPLGYVVYQFSSVFGFTPVPAGFIVQDSNGNYGGCWIEIGSGGVVIDFGSCSGINCNGVGTSC